MSIKRIEQQDVEEAAAIKIGDSVEQAQSGGLLALAGLEPLDGRKGLDRTADNLAADGAVVVLHLFDFHAALAGGNATFQAGITTTAVAGEHLDAIQCSDDPPLHATFIQGLAALQGSIDLDQHFF